MTDIVSAILAINPKAAASVENDDISKIIWLHGTTPIANSDILAKQKELIAEYNSKEYQRSRAEAYPSMADQLDDIYHNGVDEWKKTIKAVKDKYPKG
jgi:Ni,Fe-hydrogenase I small subunit